MDPNCATEVTTPTGTFTFHKERMSVCEAKKVCALKGEILAPVTNKADYEALLTAARKGNHPSCPIHYGDLLLYGLGLDITPCGRGKQQRVFTNGVVWDEAVHGKLYREYGGKTSNCAYAQLDTMNDHPGVYDYYYHCHQTTQRFICLKEAVPSNYSSTGSCSSSVSQAVSSDGIYKGSFVGLLVACFSLVGVFFAFIAIKYQKKYQAVEKKQKKLKSQQHF